MNRTKLLLAALTALLVLSIGAGTAMALRSVSISGETRLTLTGRVTFTGFSVPIICNTTFVKTLNRSISKVAGSLVGQITSITLERCAQANGTVATVVLLSVGVGTNWQIVYASFLGTLPRPTGFVFNLVRTRVLIETTILGSTLACLFENRRAGTIGVLATVDAEGIIGRLIATSERRETVETELITTLRGLCPSRGQFAASVEPAATQRTRITLI